MRITTRSRLISLLLVLVMILSLFPVAVSAAEADGNLALSAMPSAISEHPSAKTAGINDGDTSTNSRWCPAESDPTKGLPAWCQLQWGNPVTFDKIVIYEWALALRTGEYNLSVSNDGSKFTEIYNGNTLDNGTKTIELDQPVTAKYLRLTITSIREDAKKHETPSISEIEVYDNSHNATISGVEVLETEAVIDQEKGTITFEVEPGIPDPGNACVFFGQQRCNHQSHWTSEL